MASSTVALATGAAGAGSTDTGLYPAYTVLEKRCKNMTRPSAGVDAGGGDGVLAGAALVASCCFSVGGCRW